MSELSRVPINAEKVEEESESSTPEKLACSEDIKYNLADTLRILQPETYGPKTMKEVLFLREMNANEVIDRIE